LCKYVNFNLLKCECFRSI